MYFGGNELKEDVLAKTCQPTTIVSSDGRNFEKYILRV